jgi:ribonuclease P protein component
VAAPAAPGRGVRCGVVCGKKYSLKAVARNRAKRLIRESFRLLKASLEPRDIVVLAQRDMTDMSMPEIRGELAAVFRKAGIFKL